MSQLHFPRRRFPTSRYAAVLLAPFCSTLVATIFLWPARTQLTSPALLRIAPQVLLEASYALLPPVKRLLKRVGPGGNAKQLARTTFLDAADAPFPASEVRDFCVSKVAYHCRFFPVILLYHSPMIEHPVHDTHCSLFPSQALLQTPLYCPNFFVGISAIQWRLLASRIAGGIHKRWQQRRSSRHLQCHLDADRQRLRWRVGCNAP